MVTLVYPGSCLMTARDKLQSLHDPEQDEAKGNVQIKQDIDALKMMLKVHFPNGDLHLFTRTQSLFL